MNTYISILRRFFEVSAMLMIFIVTGCEQKELCYDHSHVVDLDVDFDWHNDTTAHPGSMAVYLFPKDGGKPTHYELSGCQGGTIRVHVGEYDVICFNSDTHNITLTQTDSEYSFTITAKDDDPLLTGSGFNDDRANSAPRHEGTEDERVVMQSEDMWEATLTGLVISQTSNDDEAIHAHQHVTLEPEKVTDIYHIIIKEIENMDGLRKLSGSLSGMAGGLNLASHHVTDEEVTIPFSLSFYRDTNNAYGLVESFGTSISHIHGHYLILYATMSDGQTYYYEYDVSDQVDHPTGMGHEHYIVVDLLSLEMGQPTGQNGESEEQETGGTGFNTSVEEWGDTTQMTLPM